MGLLCFIIFGIITEEGQILKNNNYYLNWLGGLPVKYYRLVVRVS